MLQLSARFVRASAPFVAADFVDRFVGFGDNVELVKGDLGVAAVFAHAFLVGSAHVHGYVQKRVGVAVVAAQLLRKAIPHGVVFAFGGIEHTAGFEVGKTLA